MPCGKEGEYASAGHTFVFFIRHLSQAFHTLLCLPSAIGCAESGEMGECRCECAVEVLARFEVRCAGFVDLGPELLFLVVCALMCSSVGGLGRLRSISRRNITDRWLLELLQSET